MSNKQLGRKFSEEKINAKIMESMEFYKNFKEYFNVSAQQELQEKIEEFEGMENNGFIQNLTLGTYNGATSNFSPRELNKVNIEEAVLTYVNEMELYDYLQENYNSSIGNYKNMVEINEKTLIKEFLENYNVFAIGDNIYVDLN